MRSSGDRKLSIRQIQLRKHEMCEAAFKIMEKIEYLDEFYPDKATRKVVDAIWEILRSKVLGNEVRPEDSEFKLFIRALNAKAPLDPIAFGLATGPTRRPPPKVLLRMLADQVSTFLRSFVDIPALNEDNPFRICARKECQELFLTVRSDQEFCTRACKSKHWNKGKALEDPDYWPQVSAAYRKRHGS